jgi:hypothetical protein
MFTNRFTERGVVKSGARASRPLTRPEICVEVMPGVELDLHDLAAELRLALQPPHALAHALHEEALAAAPITKEANRQGRLGFLGGDKRT